MAQEVIFCHEFRYNFIYFMLKILIMISIFQYIILYYLMYRKYNLCKTHVIDAYNYLLQAQDINSKAPALFHQILLSSNTLPSLISQDKCLNTIQQSQNQNLVAENNHKFQLYVDNNLLQVKFKEQIKSINEIHALSIKQIIKIIIQLNIDLLLSAKQLLSNPNIHSSNINNHNKFFHHLICQPTSQNYLILPFYSEQQIYYYDIHYSNSFANHQTDSRLKQSTALQTSSLFNKKWQTNSKEMFRLSNISKVGKAKQNVLEDIYYNQDQIFLKYLNFIIILLSNHSILTFIQELNKLNKADIENIDIQQLIQTTSDIKDSHPHVIWKSLIELIANSLRNYREYTMNIFHKECEILLEKYQRITEKAQKYGQTSNKGFISTVLSSFGKNQKEKTSKSCIIVNPSFSNVRSIFKPKPKDKEQDQKLKNSKSLIDLKSSKNNSKIRSLKKNDKIFAKSKQSINAKSSNVFKSTWMSHLKESSFNQSKKSHEKVNTSIINFTKSTASSNWFGQSRNDSMNETQLANKLRTLKKKNNRLTNTISQNLQMQSIHISQQKQKDEQMMAKSKIINQKSNFSAIKQQGENDSISKEDLQKFQRMKNNKNKQTKGDRQVQQKLHSDKCIMTQSNQTPKIQYSMPKQAQKDNIKDIKIKIQKENKPEEVKMAKEYKSKLKETTKEDKQQLQNVEKNKKTVDLSNSRVLKKEEEPQNMSKVKDIQENIPKNIQNKSIIKQNKQNKQKPMKLKKYTIFTQQQYDQEQIQQINLQPDKKSGKKVQDDKKIVKNKQQKGSKPQLVAAKIKDNSGSLQKQQSKMKIESLKKQNKDNKKPTVIKSDSKILYIKHFELLLKFYKEKFAIISILPISNHLSYLINILYFKMLVQTKFTQSSTMYNQLISLLAKKQEKLPLQMKESSLIYRIKFQELWSSGKKFLEIQKKISDNGSNGRLEQIIDPQRQNIECLYNLSCQSADILQKIIHQIYNYLYQHKIQLLQKNILTVFLELNYLLSQTVIIELQQEEYYNLILYNKIDQLQKCFRFKFQTSQDEYLKSYRRIIQSKNVAFINIEEEYRQMTHWIDEFK